MDISPIASIGNTGSAKSLGQLAGNFDDFLKLLLTQLQNQDPTSPLDTNDFTQQIVSFAGVEQSVATNKNLENLIAKTQATQNSAVASFIGKDVEVDGSLVTYTAAEGETVNFGYELDQEASQVFVTVKDLNNVTVFNGTGPKDIGRNNVQWDGTDNDGNPVDAGIYQVFATAQVNGGNLENQKTLVRGKVIGIALDGEEPKVVVNGEEIPLSEVKFIGNLS